MEYPNDSDGIALRRVATYSDMSKPMSIDFAVAVPDGKIGARIAEIVRDHGYESSVEYDDATHRWTCYCIRNMVATYESVTSAQRELNEVSRPLGGYAHGWGTFGD